MPSKWFVHVLLDRPVGPSAAAVGTFGGGGGESRGQCGSALQQHAAAVPNIAPFHAPSGNLPALPSAPGFSSPGHLFKQPSPTVVPWFGAPSVPELPELLQPLVVWSSECSSGTYGTICVHTRSQMYGMARERGSRFLCHHHFCFCRSSAGPNAPHTRLDWAYLNPLGMTITWWLLLCGRTGWLLHFRPAPLGKKCIKRSPCT